MLASRKPVLIFQIAPILPGGELESDLVGLARGLLEAGLAPRIAAGCPWCSEAGRHPTDEAERRGWRPIGPWSSKRSEGPGREVITDWLEFDAGGIAVDLFLAPSGGEVDGESPAVVGPESIFRGAVARSRPSVVLFTDRWPSRPLVESCRPEGIASALLFRGIDDSPPEPHPPVDAVLALSDFSASYYHEAYGHRPVVAPAPADLARVAPGEGDPRYLLFIDPTAANGVYPFARIADEIGRIRPDIPILVVEGEGTEADLANCGLDLAARGHLSLMATTRDPRKYWRQARACVIPSLDRSDRPTTLLRAVANRVPTVCSDRAASREIGDAPVVFLPLPNDLTPETCRLPDAEQVSGWVRELIRLWDRPPINPRDDWEAPRADDPSRPGSTFARALAATSSGPPPWPVMPPGRAKAVALVPYISTIEDSCEAGLRALEMEGVLVVRQGGQSAIDIARNDMCSQALHDGFESILFVDSDISFNVRDALRLFARPEPVISGVYAKKGSRSLASVFRDEVAEVAFGPNVGGLYPLRHAATGFLRIRSQVLRRMIAELDLPLCNTRWNRGFWPFFMPTIVEDGDHRHYLGEDWAFSHRLRQLGECPLADTTIRLWHVGRHHFGWEEAGQDRPRFESFRIKLRG